MLIESGIANQWSLRLPTLLIAGSRIGDNSFAEWSIAT